MSINVIKLQKELRAFDYGSPVKVMTLNGKFKRYEPATYFHDVSKAKLGKQGKKVRHG